MKTRATFAACELFVISVTKIEKAIENAHVVFNFSNSRPLLGLFIPIILEIEFKNHSYIVGFYAQQITQQ